MTGPITFEALAPTIQLDRESRTIRGVITEFGVPTNDYRRIVLHEGALRPRQPLKRVKMLIDHDQRQPVGFMTELSSDTRNAAFKLPPGEAGDKALEDAANGLRDGLSVGIQVLDEDGAFTYDAEHNTYHVHAAELVEVSLCAIPAYQNAAVTQVAASYAAPSTEQETPTVTDTLTADDLDQRFQQQTETFERTLETRLAHLATAGPSTGPTWASFGAFVIDLAAGAEDAKTFYQELAYTGSSSADNKQGNTWIDDAIKLIEKRRKVLNTFTVEPLPAKGMTMEYLKLKSNSITVGKQAKEGDDLPTGKVVLESDSTSVDTYGGYTEVTRQVIDRANAAYLSTAFKAMDIEYAKATEGAVRDVLAAAIAKQITAGNKLSIAVDADAYDWLDLIVDAAELYDDRGYVLEGSLVSKDVFKKLLRLEDTNGNSLMRVYGQGVNQVGELDLRNIEGNLASVAFKLLPGAAAGTMSFYDPVAITTWESAGAPWQLQDENVLNLTAAFSKYGYLASASQFPDALVPVQIGAGA
ncbi:HK97 family phage prohead protease [Labedella phragmitis]|uniref:HK97 family phage prohead protease n=1 Tax=Labedella phragmitis TaxID=2498849 RepID=UPI00140CC182|nr:HK97 family phage prohead protease [Labedella phragmitis]